MKAEFTMHVNITDRQVMLTTDTETMQGVDTSLAINIWKTLEGTRNRIKQQIDKYYGDEDTTAGDQKQESRQSSSFFRRSEMLLRTLPENDLF